MSELAGYSPTYNNYTHPFQRSYANISWLRSWGVPCQSLPAAVPPTIITRIHFNALTPTSLGSGREGYHVKACRLQSHLQLLHASISTLLREHFLAQVVRGTMSKLAGCSPTYNNYTHPFQRSYVNISWLRSWGVPCQSLPAAVPPTIITRIHFNALMPTFLGSGREGYHVRACRLQSHLQ